MRAISSRFDDPTAASRLLLAGTDLLMVCSYGTDTDRCRGFAEAMIRAEQEGVIPAEFAAASRERIHSLIRRAPQNEVRALPESVFEQHAAAAPLFAAETAEVI